MEAIDKAISNVVNGNFEASDYGQYSFMAYGGGSMVLDEGLVPKDIVNAVKAKESEILDGLLMNVNDAVEVRWLRSAGRRKCADLFHFMRSNMY